MPRCRGGRDQRLIGSVLRCKFDRLAREPHQQHLQEVVTVLHDTDRYSDNGEDAIPGIWQSKPTKTAEPTPTVQRISRLTSRVRDERGSTAYCGTVQGSSGN
jgi:hypothetical protein